MLRCSEPDPVNTSMKLITPEIGQLVGRIGKPTGSYGFDPWGYNEERFTKVLAAAKVLYDRYFRVSAEGLEHVPVSGRVLVVGNRSGLLPVDNILVCVALATNPHGPRIPRAMIERFFPAVPWVGNFLTALGGAGGDPANCGKLLDREEAVVLFPEGARGALKLYRERYQLQRFGSGFLQLAMQHRAPIVPVGVVGCEEIMPAWVGLPLPGRAEGISRLPLPCVPLPLPARIHLQFGPPLHFEPAHSLLEIETRVEEVREALGELIRLGLARRKRLF